MSVDVYIDIVYIVPTIGGDYMQFVVYISIGYIMPTIGGMWIS